MIRFVLVDTSHPGNIGAVARAMKNMGLSELVLVRPVAFPHAEATARASGADDLLKAARVCDTVAEAVSGCGLVMATTSRDREHYHRLLDYVQTLEEVRECHHLTGGDDFLLKVTTTTMADLEALIEALLPYGIPVTSLVLSSPVERRRYAVTGKLTTVTRRPPMRRR